MAVQNLTFQHALDFNGYTLSWEPQNGRALVSAGLLAVLLVLLIVSKRSRKTNVPAPGCTIPVLGPWIEAWRFIHDPVGVIEDGVQKSGLGTTFKIATPSRWLVLTSNEKVIKELGNIDEKILSMQAAADERNAIRHILGPGIHDDPFHVRIINKYLAVHLGKVIEAIKEELDINLQELSRNIGNDWKNFDDFHEFLFECVSSATNRMLVGHPLCRNKVYLDCLVKLSARISLAGQISNFLPNFIRPLVSNLMVLRSDCYRNFISFVGPVIEKRRKEREGLNSEVGNRPNDGIKWVLERAGPDSTTHDICARILYLAFSAIHTSSIGITHAIYDLAANPQYQDPIREEVESVLQTEGGWTTQALSKMKNLDSSLKESQRRNPVTIVTMMRKAMVPCTLSDGTFLPRGHWIGVAAYAINHFERHHPSPQVYDAFRFSNLSDRGATIANEKTMRKDQGMAHGNLGYLSFGIGRHACPGRYFTATELKILLGSLLREYEIKLSGPARPGKFLAFACIPDYETKLVIRKREISTM